jgi:hypothetical protein
MGLDMYLDKRVYVGAHYEHRGVGGEIYITDKDGNRVDRGMDGLSELVYKAGYWRKANQIHKWFVDNVQNGNDDCGEYYVSREQLEELRDLCLKTLYKIDNSEPTGESTYNAYDTELGEMREEKKKTYDSSLAKDLPPSSGCFFGGTEIDDWYREDLVNTVKIIHDCLADEGECSFYYSSSW